MAKKQALGSLFTVAIKNTKAFQEALSELKTEVQQIAKLEEKKISLIDTKTVEGIKELEKQLKNVSELTKGYKSVLEQEKKIKQESAKETKKLAIETDEEVKARLRYQQATQKQRKELKALLDLELAEKNSIEALRAKVRQLTIERNSLNLETKEGQDRIKELNSEIDDHNQKIKQNVDLLTQQKMNVGNYTDSIREAIEGLSGNNQALGLLVTGWEKANSALTGATNIFSNLKAEFEAVKASIIANTVATNVNTEATTTNTVATEAQTVATEANTVATNLNTRAIFRMIFSLRGLKIALASTGIGLVILALTGLVGMFSQGISGTLRFNRVMGALGAGIKNVFSGVTAIFIGVITKIGTITESISLSIDQIAFKFDNMFKKQADYYDKLAELNQRQEDLDLAQAESNIKIKEGLEQIAKTSEVMARGFDGAITSMIRKIEILKATVNLSELQKQYQTMAEFAEDDTVDFNTRNKYYELASQKRTKILKESLKLQGLETQKGLADIVSKYETTSEVINDEQKAMAENLKRLYKMDVKTMDIEQLKNFEREVQKATKQISQYIIDNAQLMASKKLEMPWIDESNLEAIAEFSVRFNEIEQELNDETIKRGEQRRKYIQDHYESLLDLQENYILRFSDNMKMLQSDEDKSFDSRLNAQSRYRDNVKKILSDGVNDFNKYTTDLENSLGETAEDIKLKEKMRGLKLSFQDINGEFKLFANGVEVNKELLQEDLFKGLTGENAEKTITFYRTLSDLFVDVNTNVKDLTTSNKELLKSEKALNRELDELTQNYELNKKQIEEKNKLNETAYKDGKLIFSSEYELAKFKEKQNELDLRQSKETAEKEFNQSTERLKAKTEELDLLEQELTKKNQIAIADTKRALEQTTNQDEKDRLQQQLDDLESFEAKKTETYKKGLLEKNKLADENQKLENNVKLEDRKLADFLWQQEMDRMKERAKLFQDVINGMEKISDRFFENQNRKIDAQMKASEKAEQRLVEAKKMGSKLADESLALEIKKQEELALKKEKLERRKQRVELVTGGLKAYASALENGVANPLQKTFTDTVQLSQFLKSLPLFFTGTENVKDSLGNPHLNESRDNYVVRVDGGERILTTEQNKKLNGISNEKLTELGGLYNSGLLKDIINLNFKPNTSSVVPILLKDKNEEYLKDIKIQLEQLPNRMPIASFDYDSLNRMTIDTIKRGNNKQVIRRKA